MKRIIDISKKLYKEVKNGKFENSLVSIGCYNAVLNSKSFNEYKAEEKTNGDILKILFPNIEIYDRTSYDNVVDVVINNKEMSFNSDWWYTPYKGER